MVRSLLPEPLKVVSCSAGQPGRAALDRTPPRDYRLLVSPKRSEIVKWVFRAAVSMAAAYALLCGVVLAAMLQPPERFGVFMTHVPEAIVWGLAPGEHLWRWARAGRLQVGDEAPDFSLRAHDRDARVSLSTFRGHRPVVLVFGSYT
jgi:hypothetical protein